MRQNTEKTKKIRQVKTQKKSKNTEKTKKIHQVKTQKKSKNKKNPPNKNTKSKQKHKKVKNNKSHNTAKNKQKKQKIWEKEEKQMLERKLKKAIAQILLIIAIATVTIISIPAGKVYASTLEPANDQKIEYRAISQEVVNGKKQLIIEVRIRKLKFKGIDLRLQYNTALLTPSNIETNAAIDVNDADGIPSNYTYINGFEKYMDMLEIEGTTGELRMVYSILGEYENGKTEYLKENAFTSEAANTVKNDLIQVVENPEGTATDMKVPGVTIAGKTGTAELKTTSTDTESGTLGWFDCFTVNYSTSNPNVNDMLIIGMVDGRVAEEDSGDSRWVRFENALHRFVPIGIERGSFTCFLPKMVGEADRIAK